MLMNACGKGQWGSQKVYRQRLERSSDESLIYHGRVDGFPEQDFIYLAHLTTDGVASPLTRCKDHSTSH